MVNTRVHYTRTQRALQDANNFPGRKLGINDCVCVYQAQEAEERAIKEEELKKQQVIFFPPSIKMNLILSLYCVLMCACVCVCQAELEAFEKRQKGRRKKNRRNTEVETQEGVWLKYRKYLLVPVCGVLLAVGAFFLLQAN